MTTSLTQPTVPTEPVLASVIRSFQVPSESGPAKSLSEAHPGTPRRGDDGADAAARIVPTTTRAILFVAVRITRSTLRRPRYSRASPFPRASMGP